MSEVTVKFATRHRESTVYMPGVGANRLDFEVVTGLQLPNSAPLHFDHYLLEGAGNGTDQLTMPKEIATRLAHFAQAHFVEGEGDFDCRTFLDYVMSWDDGITGRRRRQFEGTYIPPEETKAHHGYLVAQKDGGVTPHAMLGIERPGESLGVAGAEYPLIISQNAPLMRAFGGFALLEVDRVINLE